jgi:transcriptional regulator
MTDATPEYIAQLLGAIVGLEVRIERIVAKSKLSQNKDARDRESVIAAMDAAGADGLAAAMRRSRPVT